MSVRCMYQGNELMIYYNILTSCPNLMMALPSPIAYDDKHPPSRCDTATSSHSMYAHVWDINVVNWVAWMNLLLSLLCSKQLSLLSICGRRCGHLVIYGFHTNLPRLTSLLSPMEWLRMIYRMAVMPRFEPMDLVLDSKTVTGALPVSLF